MRNYVGNVANLKNVDPNTVVTIRTEERFCEYCGKRLKSSQKRFCSHECQNSFNYEQFIDKWKSGEELGIIGVDDISNYIKHYLFDKYHSSCQLCGWNEVNPYTGLVPL